MPLKFAALLMLAGWPIAMGAGAAGVDYCVGIQRPVVDRAAIPESEVTRIEKFHREYWKELEKQKRLVAFGRLVNSPDPRGLLVMRCESLDQAREWVSADPAVRTGQLTVDLFSWLGPKGIGEENWAEHARDPKAVLRALRYPVALVQMGDMGRNMVQDHLRAARSPHEIHVQKHVRSGDILWSSPLIGAAEREKPGLIIFPAGSLYMAKKIAGSDPAAQLQVIRYDVFEWQLEELVLPW